MIVSASWLIAFLGILAGGAGWLTSGNGLPALGMMLELWVAAGLLRLSADGSWTAVLGAGALVVLRKLLTTALRRQAG